MDAAMLGRNRELALLSAVRSEGAEDFLLFTGPRQIGKTSLLEAGAADLGAKLIRLRRSESQWPYSGLSVIALSLGGPAQESIEKQLALVRAERPHPLHLADEFAGQLRANAAPLTLFVDDIDLLDSDSAAVLEHLVPRLPGTGLRIAASATHIARSSVFAGFRQHPLRALSREESVEVAATASPDGTTREALMLLAVASDGRPGLIVSARLNQRERDGVDPIRIPLRIPNAVAPEAASHAARDSDDLLGLIALAPFSSRTALSSSSWAQQDALEDLIEHGIVDVSDDRVHIADPVERAALHAAMDARQRREVHALGKELHNERSSGIALWHGSFLDGGENLELDLLGFAEASARAGEVATAVEFAERALALRSMLPGRGDLLSLLAEALFFQGEFSLARRYLGFGRSLQHSPAGELRAARVSMLCTFAIDHVVADSAGAALVQTHRASAPEACSILLITLARLHLERWDVQPLELTLRRTVELQLVDSLAYRLLATIAAASDGEAPVLAGGEPEQQLSGAIHDRSPLPAEDAFLLCRILILDERYVEARRILDDLTAAGPLPLLLRESALALLTMLELRLGNLDKLRQALTLWTTLELPEPAPDAPRRYLIAAAAAMLEQSPSTRVNELIDRAREQCDQDDNSTLRPHVAVLAGSRALIEGRYDDAIRELRLAKRSQASFRRNPSILRADAELIESLWLAGRHDEAGEELRRLEVASREHPSTWATAAAARSAAVCAPTDALAALAFDVAGALVPDGITHTHEHARVLAARRRRLEEPPPTAPPDAARAAQPAPQRKGASALISQLDTRELELAQLVWSGHRNREIAGILFVSQRTVELRLTRIYRKLGVDSRARLVALMSLLV
ncbi:hypothetical protein C5E06_17810 [Pseudoclavibacter sp. RFBI5]|nr:hypothetical protein C5E06_17810 [Pseudoclavibacter sp. RFBI5]